MIDFRYHLVSLVSVFMALAIGVVLGAGPLKEAIGDQLSNQVEGLLEDKTALQQAVANREQGIAARDAFIEAVAPSLVGEQLGGRSVVLVTLPGAGEEQAEALVGALGSAGAEVTGRVELQDKWIDPEQREFRRTLAGTQVQYVDPRPPASAGAEGELAAVLARAVLTRDIALAGQADADAQTILGALTGGDLVEVEGDPASRATLAVVLSAAPSDGPRSGDEEWAEATADSAATLLSALDAAGSGAVLAGPLADTTAGGVLDAVRDSGLTSSVSTVDSVDTPMGRVATVLALREQVAGGAGQYGYGDAATAPVPAEAASSDGTAPTGTDG